MKKYLMALLVVFLLFFISCQTTKSSTEQIIKVMTPFEVSNEVIAELTEAVPNINFLFSDSVDFSKHSYYLIIAIDGYDNSDFYEQASPLTGPSPYHGFGGIANGKVVFTYLELNKVEAISTEFTELIDRGNFFPPKMMDLFNNTAVTRSIESNEPAKVENQDDTKKVLVESTASYSLEEKKIAVDEKPTNPNRLFWDDKYPLGNLVESDTIVKLEISKGEYRDPVLGKLTELDKAGPELFIFINHKAFEGKGHLRGLQIKWEKNETESKIITMDTTGSEIIVNNADLGKETGFNAMGRSVWSGDVVYQLWCSDYNPENYSLTYIEYEYDGIIYMAGEFTGEDNIKLADQVIGEKGRWFESDRDLNGHFIYCLLEDGSIARYGFEGEGINSELKNIGESLLVQNSIGILISGTARAASDYRIIKILGSVKYTTDQDLRAYDQMIIEKFSRL